MVQINFAKKEVNCKIVYYGPGMSGKTTNLEIIHQKVPVENKGDLTSIATEGERTLFFDFLPLDLGDVNGMNTKFQIYTVPGQIYYSSTRRLVLQGVDGIVFVADSQKNMIDENIESFQDLEDNLNSYNIDLENIPLLIQYNKRDLPDAMEVELMEKSINKYGAPYTQAVAITGEGVMKSLNVIATQILDHLNKKSSSGGYSKNKQKDVKTPGEEIYVCTIDNEKISKKVFDRFCLTQLKLTNKEKTHIQNITNELKTKYMDMLINKTVVINEANVVNLIVSKEEINSKMETFSKKLGSEEKLNEYLADRGLLKDEIENEIIGNLLTAKLLKNSFPDYKELMSVSDDEVLCYYNENSAKFSNLLEEVKDKIIIILKSRKKSDLLKRFYSNLKESKKIIVNLK